MSHSKQLPPLSVTGFDVAIVSATDSARNERDRLLAIARRGNVIVTAESAQRATNLLLELKAFSETIETARVDAKAPALKVTRDIDALAKELAEDVRNEINRLSRIIGTWNAEQDRLAAEERRKVAEREQKIIDDANREAERKRKEAADAQAEIERKAELERIEAKKKADAAQAELDAKAARTRSEAGAARVAKEKEEAANRAAAESEALRLRVEREKAEAAQKSAAASEAFVDKIEGAITENRVAAAGIVAVKTEGVATRATYEFEVTSLTQLYESNPLLVTLSPNKAAIKNALKMLDEGQHIPGVRHWKAFKAS